MVAGLDLLWLKVLSMLFVWDWHRKFMVVMYLFEQFIIDELSPEFHFLVQSELNECPWLHPVYFF